MSVPAAACGDDPTPATRLSKSLRFEILRRDNFTCRYCGASAPDAKITVDHVIPEALGGKHDPANLVAACTDCNNGKKATPPDAPLVTDVAEDAFRWAAAIKTAADAMLADLETRQQAWDEFQAAWNRWTVRGKPLPLPNGWKSSVDRFTVAGLPMPILVSCIETAMTAKKVKPEGKFRYLCGIAWNKVGHLQDAAIATIAPGTPTADSGSQDNLDSLAQRNEYVAKEMYRLLKSALGDEKFDELAASVAFIWDIVVDESRPNLLVALQMLDICLFLPSYNLTGRTISEGDGL